MMQVKKLMIVAAAVACFGAAAYAAAPARRLTALDKAIAKRAQAQAQVRSQYNPFTLERPAVTVAARAQVMVRVQGAVVRPPYRPETRSPYQPPARGPYLAAAR
jgi:cytochrome c556